MLNKEELKERLKIPFNKDLNFFIERVETFLKHGIDVHGLNLSIYLLKNKRNENREFVYEVYSFDYSQDEEYYDSIWKKYLEVYNNKFSHFDRHKEKGWYDASKPFSLPGLSTNNIKDLEAIKERFLVEKEKKFYNADFWERPFNDTNFIEVDQGWEKYIDSLEKYGFIRKFNLSWVSSYLHSPISESFDYPYWYISSYILLNIGEAIKNTGNYKRAIRPNINKLLFSTSLSLHEILIEEKQKDLIKQATKAAETKLMSRNFSHHIGSHVMPNVSLAQIRDRYKELFNEDPDFEFIDLVKSRLDTYITERNEFLCDPDSVLKPILFYSEIILPFVENVLVQDNLCGSEGLGFRKFGTTCTCDIQLNVTVNGNELEAKYDDNSYPCKLPYNGIYDKNKKIEIVPTIIGSDIPVAVPNAHVIYSILENFIRNTAKHQKGKIKPGATEKLKEDDVMSLNVSIQLNEYDKDSFYLIISDNISKVEKSFSKKQDAAIIDDENQFAHENLGIIDFKICAGLLNSKEFKDVNKEDFEIKVEDNGKLSYQFRLLKPKSLCLIGYVKSEHIQQPTFDYFETAQHFIYSRRPSVPYSFYLIKESAFVELAKEKKNFKKLSFRVLIEIDYEIQKNKGDNHKYLNEKEFGTRYLYLKKIDTAKSESQVLEECWKNWLKRWDVDSTDKRELIVHSEEKLEDWINEKFASDVMDFQYSYSKGKTVQDKKVVTYLTENYPKVFFDHHGGGISNAHFSPDKSLLSNNAYIPFGKNSKDQAAIKNTKHNPNENWLLPYQLLEAGLSRILIIDERFIDIAAGEYKGKSSGTIVTIGKFWYDKYTNKMKDMDDHNQRMHNIDAYWAANITIATHINGEPIKKGIFDSEDKHFVKMEITRDYLKTVTNFHYLNKVECPTRDVSPDLILNSKYDVIIVHRTFLNDESLNTYWRKKEQQTGSEEVLKILNKHFPLVFVTSGGGDVLMFNGNYKFISFNDLRRYLSVPENIGKFSLMTNLFSI